RGSYVSRPVLGPYPRAASTWRIALWASFTPIHFTVMLLARLRTPTSRGRFFGGDVQNQQIVSGANITSPVSSVPEPSTLLLMGTALTGLGGALWRKGLWRSEPA